MEALEKIQAAITMVTEARAVPLSASCVVHRGELLEILDEINQALPNDISNAEKLLAHREAIIEEGRQSAEKLIAHAREEVARMIEQTSIDSELLFQQMVHFLQKRLLKSLLKS